MKVATNLFVLLSSMSTCNALAMEMKRVLVTGAGGQTGQHVFRKLLAKPGYVPIGEHLANYLLLRVHSSLAYL